MPQGCQIFAPQGICYAWNTDCKKVCVCYIQRCRLHLRSGAFNARSWKFRIWENYSQSTPAEWLLAIQGSAITYRCAFARTFEPKFEQVLSCCGTGRPSYSKTLQQFGWLHVGCYDRKWLKCNIITCLSYTQLVKSMEW